MQRQSKRQGDGSSFCRVTRGGGQGQEHGRRPGRRLTFAMVVMARGCEIGLDEKEVFQHSEHLLPSDVTFFWRDGVQHARVRMRKRKDLKVLRGKQAVVIVAGGGQHFDAVQLLSAWLEARRALGLTDRHPLFCHEDGRCIDTGDVREAVRRVMAAAGRDPRLYGAHSLRIGGATAALAAGVPPQLIRLMGRWSSDVYEIYCRMSVQAALGVGSAISSAAVDSVEAGFEHERLELQPSEVAEMRGMAADAADGEDEM